jgi:hypothetical protein
LEFSLVFLGERNKKKILEEISSKIKLVYPNFQVIFLTNQNPKNEQLPTINKNLNYKTIVFDTFATNEEMFETIIQKEDVGTVILFKETAVNINFNDINRMIEQNSRGAMLVVSKQKKKENIFRKVFQPIKDFFARIFLGVRLFNGEADIILLDKILISTMTEMPGKSASLTKINGWAGVEPKYVTIDEQPKVLKNKIVLKDFVPVIAISSLFLLFIVADIVLGVLKVKIPFIWLFLFIIVQVALLAFLLYTLTKTLFRIKLGKMYAREINILDEIDNFDE